MKGRVHVVLVLCCMVLVFPLSCSQSKSKSKSSKSNGGDSVDVSEKERGLAVSELNQTESLLPPGSRDEVFEALPTQCDLQQLATQNTNGAVVAYAFCLALDRLPRKDEFVHWTRKLNNEEIFRFDVIRGLTQSEPFRKNVSDFEDNAKAFVSFLFRRLLLREPDEQGLRLYEDRIASGTWDRSEAVAVSLNSREFSEKHPIFCNLNALSKIEGHEAAVQYAYCLFLRRSAGLSEIKTLTEKLYGGVLVRHDLISEMMGSEEFKKTVVFGDESAAAFVRRMFKRLLRQEGDKSEIDGWIEELASGRVTRIEVVEGIVASETFRKTHGGVFGLETIVEPDHGSRP